MKCLERQVRLIILAGQEEEAYNGHLQLEVDVKIHIYVNSAALLGITNLSEGFVSLEKDIKV